MAGEIASAIQSASLNRHPDPKYDIAPSTSADSRQPVNFGSSSLSDIDDEDVAEDEIPLSVLDARPRRPTLPPLPDMRFEQSYLKSIEHAEGWQGVTYITIRDQILFPLIQGLGWQLILSGWRHWNSASKFSGRHVGAKIRRWWWNVNNWKLPEGQQ